MACAKCGAKLDPEVAVDLRPPSVADDPGRLRRLRLNHALAGAMTFFFINLLVGFPNSFKIANLFFNLVLSALFGLPIGWLISKAGGGIYRGAMISAGAFVLLRVILLLPHLGDWGFSAVLAHALPWSLLGLLPGAFIGIHVQADDM